MSCTFECFFHPVIDFLGQCTWGLFLTSVSHSPADFGEKALPMKIAIMQPYLFPYIGYFQLMNTVEEFVVYDNIQYSKKGWITRNRILCNGQDTLISAPLKKDSDFLDVKERELSESWTIERGKLLNRIRESYRKAPRFEAAFQVVSAAILHDDRNLFNFIFNSLKLIKSYLNIATPLSISSIIPIDHALRAEQKVIALCKARCATVYINPVGGVALYDKEEFMRSGINLQFLQTSGVQYQQFGESFIPHLSIIDVMMFNSQDTIAHFLKNKFVLQ